MLVCKDGWHPPDHTKIEKFRNRLSPETQRTLANNIAKIAVDFGFADPRATDFDSTVQEANIAYPSDASLMSKLAGMGKKFIDFIRSRWKNSVPEDCRIDLRAVKKKAREYFFLPKNKPIDTKRSLFKELHRIVKKQMRPAIALSYMLSDKQIAALPWNIRRLFDQIKNDAWRYLLDVGHFTRTQMIKAGKILAFHARDLQCIKKGKIGKEYEFGRVF